MEINVTTKTKICPVFENGELKFYVNKDVITFKRITIDTIKDLGKSLIKISDNGGVDDVKKFS